MDSNAIIIERTFQTPTMEVWNALTVNDQMKQWYFDLEEFKPEIGFGFRFIGGTENNKYVHVCEVTEVEIGRRLSYSWRYEGYAGVSFVTFRLIHEDDLTKLILIHDGLETLPKSNLDFARNNFVAGWTEIIGKNLAGFLNKNLEDYSEN